MNEAAAAGSLCRAEAEGQKHGSGSDQYLRGSAQRTFATMAADPLTAAVSERICKHMNEDHAEAVVAYARHYGGMTGARAARLLRVDALAMELDVEGQTLRVAFDHALTDSEDAHRTLVAMLRALPY